MPLSRLVGLCSPPVTLEAEPAREIWSSGSGVVVRGGRVRREEAGGLGVVVMVGCKVRDSESVLFTLVISGAEENIVTSG